jgi:hypothetical protein
MPPLQFSWSKSRMGEDTNADTPDPIGFKSLKSGGGTSIPGFLQKGAQQMVDLYGEGLPGILYTDAGPYSRPSETEPILLRGEAMATRTIRLKWSS